MDYLFPPQMLKLLVVNIKKPPHDGIYMMPTAEATIREGTFGSLIMQETRREEFCIYLQIFQTFSLPELSISVEKPYASLIYVLQGNASYSLPGMEDTQFEEGSYYLCYFPTGIYPFRLKSTIYMTVQLELSPTLLNKLTATNYGMYEAYSHINGNLANGMVLNGNWMNPRICDILSKLIYCQLDEEIGSLYQEARVRDLLLLYTEDIADKDKKMQSNFNFTSADLNAILAAQNQQIRKIDEVIYFKDIARDVNLHPKKLRVGFKKVFGKNPSTLIAEARMEKARYLLKETDKSIKDIALEVGFSNSSSFINAFKRCEGITPLQYRK